MRPAAPFASIVIPTHDRASTLGLSIRSALAQDEPAIEVLVVGDGCSEACRAVAGEWAGRDGRVRFLDWPKAPGKGHANRDRAVREARAPRIFYNDDDDLLLPHHVSTLGPLLEGCDVVDTPVVSVSPDGRIDLGVADTGDPAVRRLLAEGRFKAVFDTHLAHTQDAYLRLRAPWISRGGAGGTSTVFDMLRAFAAEPSVTWRSVPRVTALSFHGARRANMPPWQRRAELERWSTLVAAPGIEAVLRGIAGHAFHAVQLADALRADALRVDALRAGGASADDTRATMPAGPGDADDPMREEVATSVDLVHRRAGWGPALESVFHQLLHARYGASMPVRRAVQRFRPQIDVADLLRAVERPDGAQSPPEALVSLLLAQRTATLAPDLVARLDAVFATCPSVDGYGFALEAAHILAERAATAAAARRWCERAVALAPASPQALPALRLKRDLAAKAGDAAAERDAATAIGRLEPTRA